MILNKTIQQFQIEPSFPQQVDLKSILPFINPIPNLNLLVQSPTNNLKQLFIESKQKILQSKMQIEKFINEKSQLLQVSEYDFQYNEINNSIKKLKKIEITPEKISRMRKLEIIYHKYKSFLQHFKKALHTYQSQKEHLISDFLLVCEWFISNPRPFYINVENAFPNISLQFYSQNRELVKHFSMLEYALKLQLKYISLLPDQLFSSSDEMNLNFIKNALQTALNQKKNDTSYFEPLKCEESLFIFFQSRSSPIFTKIKELDSIRNFTKPIFRKSGSDRDNDETISELNTFVLKWIKESSEIILKFLNQKDFNSEDERKSNLDAIEIMIVRFVFNITFPYLDWQPLPDPTFSRQIEILSKMTARNLQISLNFLHPDLADVECTKIFERDSASRAPVEWITSAQYEVCPVRAAYCMSKAHESLTIMATIAATDNELNSKNNETDSKSSNHNQNSEENKNFLNSHQNQNSQNSVENQNSNNSSEKQSEGSKKQLSVSANDSNSQSAAQKFFSKVPGFDDIFNFWVSLVCTAKLADPRGLNQFIKDWINLPGISNRARAACTYFEAAIAHIESGEAIDKCQK